MGIGAMDCVMRYSTRTRRETEKRSDVTAAILKLKKKKTTKEVAVTREKDKESLPELILARPKYNRRSRWLGGPTASRLVRSGKATDWGVPQPSHQHKH